MTRSTSRRGFLHAAAATGAALGLVPFARGQAPAASTGPGSLADTRVRPASRPLRVLILGGTGFLGPHVVEAARARGHELTLFNRGRTNPGLFPGIAKRRGDRDPAKGDGLAALERGEWDAVIDTSGYVPRHVDASARLLADRVAHYVFVSTISVYADLATPGLDENAPVATLDDPTVEEVNGATYGPLKALCEQAAETAFPGRATSIRPGLIVGPRDQTDRFTYWPVRVRRGGAILAPGDGGDPVTWIDVRDLAAWTVHVVEARTTGVFNAVGPEGPCTMAELLHGCKAVTGGDARFTWMDAAFLAAQSVAPWSDLPVWVPQEGRFGGMGRISRAAAVAAGLTFRPLAETVDATLAWWDTLDAERQMALRAGLAPEREQAVLDAWATRGK